MEKVPVIVIFDVGKTNKKWFLFNERYEIVREKTTQFPETQDEDGDVCEDIALLTGWIQASLIELFTLEEYDIKAVNFSAYGASFVYLDAQEKPVGALYNYLKPFAPELRRQFYAAYGGEQRLSLETASPVLDSLNSGLQLYRLKYEKPEIFAQIRYALHLPQYLNFLLTHQPLSDLTSIGCHTMLWDFNQHQYHQWVEKEGFDQLLGPLASADSVLEKVIAGKLIQVGTGLHDSSAALIPYLAMFQEPFVLISTGTWCISLNPFNKAPLTAEELQYDCLCYLSFKGEPVKASRLFAGYEHEQQVKRLSEHFGTPLDQYKTVGYRPEILRRLRNQRGHLEVHDEQAMTPLQRSLFGNRPLSEFETYEEAYHQLMLDLVSQQLISTNLVLTHSPVKRMFVDGGFSKNSIYMNLLAAAFPETELFAASVAQATALGAALAIHSHWNRQPLRGYCIELKHYAALDRIVL